MKLDNLINQMDIINYNKDLDNEDSYYFNLECGKIDDLELENLELENLEVI